MTCRIIISCCLCPGVCMCRSIARLANVSGKQLHDMQNNYIMFVCVLVCACVGQ